MPRRWRNIDTMQLAGALKNEWDLSANNRPALIAIDSIGIGAGVLDRLHEQNLPVLGINVAEASSTTGRGTRQAAGRAVDPREGVARGSQRAPAQG